MRTPAFWRTHSTASLALTPFAWLYGIGAWLDRMLTRPATAPIPIISVGNATAGGAGKTPVAMALAPLVKSLGMTPHFISRGYGGNVATPHLVAEEDRWQEVGDEALLLTRIAPTWVGRKRIASARVAAQAGADIAICDDAHQHHSLRKTISFLVVDGPYGAGNGKLLPAGPLREPMGSALKRCDAVIIVGNDVQQIASRTLRPVFHATLEPSGDTAPLRKGAWFAFAGTGRPDKFFASLYLLGTNLVGKQAFPDHHPYSEADILMLRHQAEALGARLITTEKDRVKLSPEMAAGIATLPVTLAFRDPQAVRDFLRSKLGIATS